MTQPPEAATPVELMVRLARRADRAEAAELLSRQMGVSHLLVLIRDPEVDAMLAAPGLDQTLRGGPAWRAFVERCRGSGRHEAEVDLPSERQRRALAIVSGNIALVMVGGVPDRGLLEIIEPLLPMLGAALDFEQQVVVAEAQATDARLAAGHANVLAKALEASRAEGAALNVSLRDEHRRKNDFLAMLAHELRNPLSPLVTSIELLRRRGGDAKMVNRQLDAMARQVDQLSRLVEDLLEVSRVSHGRISLRREVLVLGDVISEALESSRLLIDVRHHRVTLEGIEQPLLVDADRVRLTQVFGNLINNSAKYSEPGSTIAISVAREDDLALVRVMDNGMGISAATLPRVFELFEQSPLTRGRAQGGLGIGLTLVKSLVGLHNGSVEAQSPGPEQGSTFTVRLPLAKELSRVATESISSEEADPAALPDALRILVVDDNQDAADSMAEILRMLGHHAEVAHSGVRAVQVAADLEADLLLLDIGLPEIDGYELARRLRRMGHRHAWLVAVTGFGSEEDKRRSLEAGFDEHIVKPVKLELIREIIGRAIHQRDEQRDREHRSGS